jgi:predicted PhzF superfamily epimerase YddE/YHI9
LTVRREGDLLVMDFPSRPPRSIASDPGVAAALGRTPLELGEARDILAVFESEEDVLALAPDFARVKALGRPLIVTAPGHEVDFVSRFFASSHGIDEDPVTGSAHCTLIPYWSKRLGKKSLRARQVSKRGGELFCEDQGARVLIGGHAARYLEGRIQVPGSA